MKTRENMTAPPGSRPAAQCAFCGSTWFRVAEVNGYERQGYEHPRPTAYGFRRRPSEPRNTMLPQIRVCLCGAPYRPVLGGAVHGGPAVAGELSHFRGAVDGAVSELKSMRRGMEKTLVDHLGAPLRREDLDVADARLRAIEEELLREQRKVKPETVKGIRKAWKKITREPEARGRDELVLELQKKGFTYRAARRLVKVIFEAFREELRVWREVETPIGVFRLDYAPPERTHMAFGRPVTTYKKKFQIRFFPAADLEIRAGDEQEEAAEDEVMDQMEEDSEYGPPAKCPRCGSTWLMEAEFRRYVGEAYGSLPGADIMQLDELSFPLRICLCGEPIVPKVKQSLIAVTPGLEDFLASVDLARRHRRQVGAIPETVAELKETLASRELQNALLGRLETIRKVLEKGGWDPTEGF